MTGSSQSSYLVRMARMALTRGAAAVRVNLRNSGEGAGLSRLPYHSGRSDDIRAVLAHFSRAHANSPLGLIGYSLGGNISLKLTAELAEHPIPALGATASVAAPIDLSLCADALCYPSNRIYEVYFVRRLMADARLLAAAHPDAGPPLPPLGFARRMTIRTFDDRFTAPRSGFSGAAEYYAKSSSAPMLSRITIPTLLVTAQDDPFVPFRMYAEATLSKHIHSLYPRHGGHCAFIGGGLEDGYRFAAGVLRPNVRSENDFANPAKNVFWAEQRAMDFVWGHIANA
jgi:uncharacterized protein